jgi:hypothetical protein
MGIADFTFNVSDLIMELTEISNQWKWRGPCRATIPADPADKRSEKRWNADMSVVPISECVLLYCTLRADLDDEWRKKLSAAEVDGTDDATVITIAPGKENLWITIGLRPQRYELFRTFVTLHFGRPDLICRIISSIEPFAWSPEDGKHWMIPTYNEFLEGRPYITMFESDFHFSAKADATEEE